MTRYPLCLLTCLLAVICWSPHSGLGAIHDPFTSIQLDKAVHFLAAD